MNCKLCNKKMTASDKYFNQYAICKACLEIAKYKSLKFNLYIEVKKQGGKKNIRNVYINLYQTKGAEMMTLLYGKNQVDKQIKESKKIL